MASPQCEAMTPEREVEIERYVQTDEAGLPVLGPDGKPIERVRTGMHPAMRCENEATARATSSREVLCDQGTWHMVQTDSRVFCRACFTPGTVVLRDGTITQSPVMAV